MKGMEKLVEAHIELDRKMVSKSLPSTMTLYAVDSDHFVISSARSRALAQTSLITQSVKVSASDRQYLIHIPKKIYEFYRLEKNDYTIMVSEKDPSNIVVSI